MTKIEEFEQHLIKNGMSDTDFEEYKKLLRRVQGNFSKCQHCYTTAIQFAPGNSKDAIFLIQYGIDNFNDGWFTEYTSYLMMGHIYEKNANYREAYNSFLKAESALGEHQMGYIIDISIEILWAKLHVDRFEYSDIVARCYNRLLTQSEFAQNLLNNKFRMTIAKIVISLHDGCMDEAKEAYNEAMKMCEPCFAGKLTAILKKHNYSEKINATKESRAFLADISRRF